MPLTAHAPVPSLVGQVTTMCPAISGSSRSIATAPTATSLVRRIGGYAQPSNTVSPGLKYGCSFPQALSSSGMESDSQSSLHQHRSQVCERITQDPHLPISRLPVRPSPPVRLCASRGQRDVAPFLQGGKGRKAYENFLELLGDINFCKITACCGHIVFHFFFATMIETK